MAATKLALSKKKSTPVKQISTKTTMNLAFHESKLNAKTVVPIAVVLVIFAAVFTKVGFLDLLTQKTIAVNDLASRTSQLAIINAGLTDYDSVANEYGRYSYGWMTDEESSMVDRMDALSVVERIISPVSVVDNFSINRNVLSVTMSGLTLEQTSTLVKTLEADPLVDQVSVYSADAKDGPLQAQISMTIILTKGEN